MVAFLIFCVVCLVIGLAFVLLCMSNTEARLSAAEAERDELFLRVQQAEFERDRLRAESKRDRESFDYLQAQVEKLNHDFKHYQGGK
jgi:hypothetical protein